MISEDNLVTIIFEDSAPGVKPDDCERLFNPLHRQDESRTRRRDGSGLGLAISRNIVEAHRGKILASPSKLGGLKITITFPIINGYRR
jgi:two-component system sensor histidine kinase BaeS